MNIAIVLTHNQGDDSNRAQIAALVPLVTKIVDAYPVYDDQDKQIGIQQGYHYELAGLTIPHRLKCYQIVPFGVTPPTNLDLLDSHKVFYGKGDEDKIGQHPRFFNWGMKRATDYGADLTIYLTNASVFTVAALKLAAAGIKPTTGILQPAWGVIMPTSTFRAMGQLAENVPLAQSLQGFKTRLMQGGLING